MIDWTKPENINARALELRKTAETDRIVADMRLQFAVTLEDIADALEKEQPSMETMTWLMWGNKVKCSECGAVTDKGTSYCPECGRVNKG